MNEQIDTELALRPGTREQLADVTDEASAASLAEMLKQAAAECVPNVDVLRAVMKGQLTPRQGDAILRRRDKDARRTKPVRVFRSLPSEKHEPRRARRASATMDKLHIRANTKAVFMMRDALDSQVSRGRITQETATARMGRFVAACAAPPAVGLAGVVFKAGWPKDPTDRVATKVAQRRIRVAS